MIPYIHFAFNNLYLLNGYKEINTSDGVIHEYESTDKLEQCVRKLVLRKTEPLIGWDLRFLRRGVGISQAEFGAMIDRDAQSVARWEKQQESIPKFVDIAIRLRFSEHIEPSMSVKELMDCIEGRGQKLPDKIYFRINNGEWYFELGTWRNVALATTENIAKVNLPHQSARARGISWRHVTQETTRNIPENAIARKGTEVFHYLKGLTNIVPNGVVRRDN